MRKIKRWRYYCAFCRKSGGRKDIIEKHEKGCTLNPSRACGMCKVSGNVQEDIQLLTEIVERGYARIRVITQEDMREVAKKEVINSLREHTNDCPSCILAAIRQAHGRLSADDESYDAGFNFDFKQACKIFWENING